MSLFGRMLITCFGLGYLRPAPGTWGSLPPVVLTLMLVFALSNRESSGNNVLFLNAVLVMVLAAFSAACLKFGASTEEFLGKKDPGTVVADEVAGQCLALLFLPWHWTNDAGGIQANILLAGAAFLAFRILDIVKPPPARGLQRIGGGLGILIDDLIVGVYANILVQVAARTLIH